jgi:hypothetical protein
MQTWVRCSISSGQFSDEVAVEGRQFDGKLFSLIVPDDFVDAEGQSIGMDEAVEGWIRADKIERKDDLVLVRLPRHTFQNGPFVTVTSKQLRSTPEPQKIS